VTDPLASPPLDLVTTAVLTLLRGDVAKDRPRWVYDAGYAGDPLKPPYPYGLLYRLTGGSTDPFPTLDDDPREVTVPYQVTAVGQYRNQCERAGQHYRDRLLARTADGYTHPLLLPDGWQCIRRRPDPAMPGIDRSGAHPNTVFSLPARYLLTIAPA